MSRPTTSTGICRLPTEITVLIFEHGGRATLRDDGLPFALLVSHVSRDWRRIAAGTPSVWCSVPVHPFLPRITEQYLACSAQLPLDVCLHFKKPAKAQEALSLLLQQRHRWSGLSLRASSGAEVFLLISNLKKVADSLPQLSHFEIRVAGNPNTVGQVPELFTGGRPEALRSITLHGVSFDFRSSVFAGLKRLDLAALPRSMGVPPFSSFRELFSVASELEYLRLADVFPMLIDGVEYGEIELPSLTTLELVMKKEEDYVPIFFSIIAAPALTTLHFESDWSTTWDGFELAVEFLSAKFPALETLRLSILTVTAQQTVHNNAMLPEFFACFPELRTLSLSSLHDSFILQYILTQWIGVLGGDQDDGVPMYDDVWPKLELLAIRAPFDEDEDEDTIDDALDLLGSIRISRGQSFDVLTRPIFADLF